MSCMYVRIQVITCEEIIGWRGRENGIGTRVVLFMTDQEFHFAGEGRVRRKDIRTYVVHRYVHMLVCTLS